MQTLVKDLKPGQYIQGSAPENILKVENVVPTPEGVSIRFSLHGNLTEFASYNPYDSFVTVTMH